MSVAETIRTELRNLPRGRPFATSRFAGHGSRGAVDRALSRIVEEHPCFESSPDSVFFDGFWGSGSGFSTSCPHLDDRPGTPKRAGHGVVTGRLIRSLPGGPPAGRGPSGRQPAASAVRSSHLRRSRSRAFAVTTSFRMTAVTATLWGFPLSTSRPWNAAISGLNLQAAIAAM